MSSREAPLAVTARPARRRARERSARTATGTRFLLCLLGSVLTVYSTQPDMLLAPRSVHDGCGCSSDCVCRRGGGRCTCSSAAVSLGARCGCTGVPLTSDVPFPPLAATLAWGPAAETPARGGLVRATGTMATHLAVGREPPDPP